jgi:flavodoxin
VIPLSNLKKIDLGLSEIYLTTNSMYYNPSKRTKLERPEAIKMKIIVYHASKFGNGERVAKELARILGAGGHQVNVQHVKQVNPKKLPSAELYIFGAPTRIGKPIGSMRRFLKKAAIPQGTKYAVFATHGEEVPDKKTGKMPTETEMERWRRTIPIMDEVLLGKGLVKVAEKKFFVSAESMKGPLKEGWEEKVKEFAKDIGI